MIRNFKPNKNVPLAGLDRLRTRNQDKKIWEYLRRYQSTHFVKRKLRREFTTNRALVNNKANQLAALMIQSEKYYDAAKHSSSEIRPLLLYYGMLGLSKCLILSGDNNYSLSALDPANLDHSTHGLSFTARTSDDQRIRDGNRISNEFCYVATNRQRTGLYNLLRQCYSDTVIPNNTRFSVRELLSLIPEVHKEYFGYFRDKPKSWGCSAHFGLDRVDDNKQLIEFIDWYYHTQKRGRERYATTIFRCFPELRTLYRQEAESDDRFRLVNEADSIDDFIYVSQLMTGETFALMRLDNFALSDIDVHFLLMYILSNLVRYRQDKWARLIRRLDNDEMFLIDSFLEISLSKFPYLILRELDNIDYVFTGQVATWG